MMDDREKEAMDRIARTADGQTLYRYLQRILCEVVSPPNEGALREHNGRRSFASDLMTQMGEGIASGGRHDDAVILNRRDEQPRRKLGRREWIAANEPSWVNELYPDSESGGTRST